MAADQLEKNLSIMDRVVAPDEKNFSPGAAQALLEMGFCKSDKRRFHELVEKANGAELTESEKSEAEVYRQVESWLIKMKSKARVSLG